jgi:type IV secretion system protein VirB9
MTLKSLIAALFAVAFAAGALAQGTTPEPGPADPRIRTVVYNPNAVVSLRGHLGYQMMIEFDPNERIENVSIGDSTAWQVTPNRKATLLFVKPVDRRAATNMTVVTNVRRYAFELTASEATGPGDSRIIFGVRFLYPDSKGATVIDVAPPKAAEPSAAANPADLNFAYSHSGSKRIAPLRVFDDGRRTYFQFPATIEPPAIFVRDSAGVEGLSNATIRGGYTVVDTVAPSFALRFGKERANVKNDAFPQTKGR